ncbi:MAG: YjdF family protein [Clostridiales bacterium]
MNTTVSKLTIMFDAPFWIGLYERENNGQYEVCKIMFGDEPKDYEVYDFIMKNWIRLRFSPPIEAAKIAEKQINPKRMQRLIKKKIKATDMGTKAQQALKIQQEQRKLEGKCRSRKQRKAEKQQKFELQQEKRKKKHRGH